MQLLFWDTDDMQWRNFLVRLWVSLHRCYHGDLRHTNTVGDNEMWKIKGNKESSVISLKLAHPRAQRKSCFNVTH